MRAWLFQVPKQLAKLGDACPWSVGWYDPDGKRKGKTVGSKSMAEKYASKMEGQLASGTYLATSRTSWADFAEKYKTTVAASLAPASRDAAVGALERFEETVKPAKVAAIKTATIDEFIALRRLKRGMRPGSTISPATINKELRHLKAALHVAHEWGYLPLVPRVRMLKEHQKLPVYVTAEHFALIYDHCELASAPMGLPYPPRDFWRGLLTFAFLTGWRIGECLSLRRADLDLEAGKAITRAADNKGKRDEVVPLHPVVIEHLRPLASFHPVIFPWHLSRAPLLREFHAIQTAAGIHLDCHEKHEHTEACHLYSFHDLRRSFATLNAEALGGDVLQRLMRHKSYSTTQRYINMAQQVNSSVAAIYVPDVLSKKQA
jgi:integrase